MEMNVRTLLFTPIAIGLFCHGSLMVDQPRLDAAATGLNPTVRTMRVAIDPTGDSRRLTTAMEELVRVHAPGLRVRREGNSLVLICPETESDAEAQAERLLEHYEALRRTEAESRERLIRQKDLFASLSQQIRESAEGSSESLAMMRCSNALISISDRLLRAREERVAADAELRALDHEIAILEEAPRTFEKETRNPAFESLQKELTELAVERAELATKYVEGSVWLRRIDEKVAALRDRLEREPELLIDHRLRQYGDVRSALQLDRVRAAVRLASAAETVAFLEEQARDALDALMAVERVRESDGSDFDEALMNFGESLSVFSALPALRLAHVE